MTERITNMEVGKYKFRIIDNEDKRDGIPYSRGFKIGGTCVPEERLSPGLSPGGTEYSDCVNVSITYDVYGTPISAKIPTLVYVPECSFTAPLERGEGSITIIKTLLRHVNKELPTITTFEFEDMSTIECGTEEEQHQKRRRKKGTYAVPVTLYYFSIAFNGITWYEKHFNAYYKSPEDHKKYRKQISNFLTMQQMMPFIEFLTIAKPSEKIKNELEPLYTNATTYGAFFDSISYEHRCRLVRDWIAPFMSHCLKGVFFNDGWMIDVAKMDIPPTIPARRPHRQGAGTRKKSRRATYYIPKGNINLARILHDVGA